MPWPISERFFRTAAWLAGASLFALGAPPLGAQGIPAAEQQRLTRQQGLIAEFEARLAALERQQGIGDCANYSRNRQIIEAMSSEGIVPENYRSSAAERYAAVVNRGCTPRVADPALIDAEWEDTGAAVTLAQTAFRQALVDCDAAAFNRARGRYIAALVVEIGVAAEARDEERRAQLRQELDRIAGIGPRSCAPVPRPAVAPKPAANSLDGLRNEFRAVSSGCDRSAFGEVRMRYMTELGAAIAKAERNSSASSRAYREQLLLEERQVSLAPLPNCPPAPTPAPPTAPAIPPTPPWLAPTPVSDTGLAAAVKPLMNVGEYKDARGPVVSFPQGARAFADRVREYTLGDPAPSNPKARDGAQVLGIPNNSSISLGCGGSVVVEFVDNVLVNVPGADLYVYEIGPEIEAMDVQISTDGGRWISAGRIEGTSSAIDIQPFATAGARYRFVRLTDGGTFCRAGGTAGADIDAVGAIGSLAPPPLQNDDPLGTEWSESESGWSGRWIRRGSSNTFDATWNRGGEEVKATLTINIAGNRVTVQRGNATDANNCRYEGTLSGNSVSGTYNCTSNSGRWSATIRNERVQPPTPPPPPPAAALAPPAKAVVIFPPVRAPEANWDGRLYRRYSEWAKGLATDRAAGKCDGRYGYYNHRDTMGNRLEDDLVEARKQSQATFQSQFPVIDYFKNWIVATREFGCP